ncbi:hypothetical protein GCM10027615_70800 [Plantactinospora veratri]
MDESAVQRRLLPRTEGSPKRPFRIGEQGRPQPQSLPFQPQPWYDSGWDIRSQGTRCDIIGPSWRPDRTEKT